MIFKFSEFREGIKMEDWHLEAWRFGSHWKPPLLLSFLYLTISS